MAKEIYKQIPIEGFEHYEVSNMGNVRSFKYGKQKQLKPQTEKTGYKHVRLYPSDNRYGSYPDGRGKKPKLFKVHRLVLIAFTEKPKSKLPLEPNHKNGDKADNRLSNLEWMNRSDNLRHAYDIGLSRKGREKVGRERMQITKALMPDGTELYFNSRLHASLYFDISTSTIRTSIFTPRKTKKGKAKGVQFFDCNELPVSETFTKVLNIEQKLLRYRKQYYEKYRDYRRAWYYRNKAKKS